MAQLAATGYTPRVRTAEEVLSAALELEPGDRAKVASELLASLDDAEEPDASRLWVAEIERRVREIDSGAVKLIPWPEVRARVLARLRSG